MPRKKFTEKKKRQKRAKRNFRVLARRRLAIFVRRFDSTLIHVQAVALALGMIQLSRLSYADFRRYFGRHPKDQAYARARYEWLSRIAAREEGQLFDEVGSGDATLPVTVRSCRTKGCVGTVPVRRAGRGRPRIYCEGCLNERRGKRDEDEVA